MVNRCLCVQFSWHLKLLAYLHPYMSAMKGLLTAHTFLTQWGATAASVLDTPSNSSIAVGMVIVNNRAALHTVSAVVQCTHVAAGNTPMYLDEAAMIGLKRMPFIPGCSKEVLKIQTQDRDSVTCNSSSPSIWY